MKYSEKISYCQVVAQMMVADGVLTDDERAFLGSLMTELGLTDDEREHVFNTVNIGDDVAPRLEKIEDRQALERLLIELRAASSVDGDVSEVERDLMARVEALLEG